MTAKALRSIRIHTLPGESPEEMEQREAQRHWKKEHWEQAQKDRDGEDPMLINRWLDYMYRYNDKKYDPNFVLPT